MSGRNTAAAGVALLAFLVSCSPEPDHTDDARLLAYVSVAPQREFVQRIGGARVEVQALLRSGQSPHTFEPTPRQMMALSKARVFFSTGRLPFEERLIEKLRGQNAALTIVDTSEGVDLRTLHGHAHGDHQHHGHEEPDPHIWLSPPAILVQAKTIANALSAADPGHAAEYEANQARFCKEVEEIHRANQEKLAPFKGRSFYVFHPAFGYFADAYGLKQEAVETGGKRPSPKQLQTLIESARREGVRVIFVQPQFDQRNAETVAKAINGVVVPLDPLSEDVLKNLDRMASKIAEAFRNS